MASTGRYWAVVEMGADARELVRDYALETLAGR